MSLLPQRRIEERVNREVPVLISGIDANGSSFDESTITDNLSPKGLCLLLTRCMTPGRILIVKRTYSILVTAEVRWCHPLDEGMHEIGCFLPFATDEWTALQLATG